jgi:hypothetical protein
MQVLGLKFRILLQKKIVEREDQERVPFQRVIMDHPLWYLLFLEC